MSAQPERMPIATPQTPQPAREQRVILHGVSWETYERLLEDFADSHAAHFAYDQGILEIMVLSTEHEEPNRTLALLVELVAAEMNIDVRRLGSTTFKRPDLAKGFEPDSCFYIQNEARIRGKKEIDLATDPAPDLVIEIDITSASLNKFPIYAKLGVPEIWRYDGNRLHIFELVGDQYRAAEQSRALPLLTGAVIAQFLKDNAMLRSTVWLRRVVDWAREQLRQRGA